MVKTSPCKGCGAPIIWALTKNDKPIPLDPPKKLHVAVGHKSTGTYYGSMIVEMKDTYMPHHATCPEVEQFRKDK